MISDNTPPTNRMRRAARRTFVTVAPLLSLILASCDGDSSRTTTIPTHGQTNSGEIVLAAESPKRGYIKEADVAFVARPILEPLAGKLVYDETRTVRVRSPVRGRVLRIPATLGSKVTKGLALLELDSPELGQAQAEYQDAQADLSLQQANFDRIRRLFEKGIIPRKEFEQVQDSLTRARVEAERSRLKLDHLGVTGDRTDNRFVLRSPIAGTVTEIHANPGMEVRLEGDDPLFVISDLHVLWLQMEVYERDLAAVHIGQHVGFTVPAYPGQRFSATVDVIGKVVDAATRTVTARCRVPNPDGRLLPAMYAVANVESDPSDRALVVPLTALFTEGESDWLFVALGDGRYHKRAVDIGFRTKDSAVITQGLATGERIVVEGALLLRSEEDNIEQTGEQPRR
ncbi:MAG: efflux RND transporter periplasmic adaptor subunit [Methylotetracoccus sp.]